MQPNVTNIQGTRRVARKPHRCYFCGEPISIGQDYADERAIVNGQWQTQRNHIGHSNMTYTENSKEGLA